MGDRADRDRHGSGGVHHLHDRLDERARGEVFKVLVEQRMTSSVSAKLPKQPQGFVLTFREWIEKYTRGKSDRWLAVDEMRLVRNCIAHANGLVAEAADLDELRRILTLKKGAYEDEFGFVAIEKQFCDAAHQDVSGLLDDIYQTTNFGAPFFLRRRQPSEISITTERKGNSTVFGVIGPDQDL